MCVALWVPAKMYRVRGSGLLLSDTFDFYVLYWYGGEKSNRIVRKKFDETN